MHLFDLHSSVASYRLLYSMASCMMATYIIYFSEATSYVTTSECESSTQAVSELNEIYKLNDSEIEGSDNLGPMMMMMNSMI